MSGNQFVSEELDHDLVGVEGEAHAGGVECLDESGHDAVHEAVEDVRHEAVGGVVPLEDAEQELEAAGPDGGLAVPLTGLEAGLASGDELAEHPGQHDGAVGPEVAQARHILLYTLSLVSGEDLVVVRVCSYSRQIWKYCELIRLHGVYWIKMIGKRRTFINIFWLSFLRTLTLLDLT